MDVGLRQRRGGRQQQTRYKQEHQQREWFHCLTSARIQGSFAQNEEEATILAKQPLNFQRKNSYIALSNGFFRLDMLQKGAMGVK
jgi:hypothetical protein